MLPNVENEFGFLNSEYAILAVLKNMRPKRFKVIQVRAKLSSRTVSKHLSDLADRRLISKGDGGYCITRMGLAHLADLPHKLKDFRQYRQRIASLNAMQLVQEHVHVARITPFENCVGVVHVSLPRLLNPQERHDIDQALTHAIRTIIDSVPSDSNEYNATITGTSTPYSPKISPA